VQTLFVMVAFALLNAAILALTVRAVVFRRIGRLAERLERKADAAGTPPERVVQIGARDKLVRLEALFERLIGADGRDPAGGAPTRAARGEKGPERPKA
jgi:hypothetical protein